VALRCHSCGRQGVLVAAYGAEVDTVEGEVLVMLGDARRRRP
jgi:hypothetical protein